MRRIPALPSLLWLLLTAPALARPAPAESAHGSAPKAKSGRGTPEQAKQFVKELNGELKRLYTRQQTAEWIKNTYITDDTERNAASENEDVMAYTTHAIQDSLRFKGLKLDFDTGRMLGLLRLSAAPLPAPDDPARRAEEASIAAKLEGMYGKGKWCPDSRRDAAPFGRKEGSGKDGKKPCRDLQQLSNVLASSHDWDELLDAWYGWHTISRDMRPMYARLVELANQGAKEIGYGDLGDLWKSGYDMPPADFEKETDRLWQQVKPLYDELHCYVRAQLTKKYGKEHVPPNGPIPANVLGNMWAQEWSNIYPLVEPYPGQASLDVTAAMKKQGYDPIKMVKLGESFFTSLGLDPLPKSFWENSMFTRPRDREVVCHASAWDVTYNNDLRIKMCIETKEEDLITIHHELGHDYYFHSYYTLPVLYQQGANDGFHEAIGDALTLSITPGYWKRIGLLESIPTDDKNLINVQMKRALEKVALLPWTKIVDQWRWDVFSGKTKTADYNKAWWELRRKYEGIDAPVARSESDFDPGAKYHIPASVPYTRYFLALILQFQFHRALCQAAGFKGPLHECSIYGNKEAGKRLKAMLSMGASKPWPDALEALTGQRQLDATAILDYFAPLRAWLKEHNQGQQCGW